MTNTFNFGDDFSANYLTQFKIFSIFDYQFPIYFQTEYENYWNLFFMELQSGFDFEETKKKLIKRIATHQYPDILEENILQIWNSSPDFFIMGQLKNCLDIIENEYNIEIVLREIKINKIID